MKRLIWIAKIGVQNDRARNRFIMTIVVICLALILAVSSMINGFSRVSENYKTGDPALRKITAWPDDGTAFDRKLVEKIGNLPHIVRASQVFNIFLSDNYRIEIEGEALLCLPLLRGMNRSLAFSSIEQDIELTGTDTSRPILSGRGFLPSDEGKAIIDENTVYLLGYSTIDALTGTTVTVVLNDGTEYSAEIVGVCSNEYGYTYSTMDDLDEYSRAAILAEPLCHPLFFSDDIMDALADSKEVVSLGYENLIISTDNTDNVKQLCEDIASVSGYKTSSMLATIETKADNVRNAGVLLYGFLGILTLSSLIGMIDTLFLKINRQKKYTEVLIKIGYSRRDISMVYVLENMYITIKAMLSSIGMSLLFSVGFDMYMFQGYSELTGGKKYLFLPEIKTIVLLSVGIVVAVALSVLLVSHIMMSKIEKDMNV